MIRSGPRPRFTGGLVHLYEEGDPRASDTTLLVAALLSLGIPPAGPEFFVFTTEQIRGENRQVGIWMLSDSSPDERFYAAPLARVWNDHAWLVKNPKHPLAILRNGLTYQRTFSHTPKLTLAQLERLETPDAWIEAAMRNLITILRELPAVAETTRGVVRFSVDSSALVPRCLPETSKTKFLKYVENPGKRA